MLCGVLRYYCPLSILQVQQAISEVFPPLDWYRSSSFNNGKCRRADRKEPGWSLRAAPSWHDCEWTLVVVGAICRAGATGLCGPLSLFSALKGPHAFAPVLQLVQKWGCLCSLLEHSTVPAGLFKTVSRRFVSRKALPCSVMFFPTAF